MSRPLPLTALPASKRASHYDRFPARRNKRAPSGRAAHLLIEQHGEDAPDYAGRRTKELLEAGDVEGRAVWIRIAKAVKELLRRSHPDNDAAVHQPVCKLAASDRLFPFPQAGAPLGGLAPIHARSPIIARPPF